MHRSFSIFILFTLVCSHPLHHLNVQPDQLACAAGQHTCVQGQRGHCVNGRFELQPCASGTICAITSEAQVACISRDENITSSVHDHDLKIRKPGKAKVSKGKNKMSKKPKGMSTKPKGTTGKGKKTNTKKDPQTSLTLDPAVIAKGFATNGLNGSDKSQAASLTSTNNFINFCKTVNLPITNGRQVRGGSCNPAPMGMIPSNKNMPSCKFVFPKNGEIVKKRQTFTIQMAVRNLETGNFVNPTTSYFAAPQQLNKQGTIIGHSHIVIEKLTSLDQTKPTDPNKFAFFKGLNAPAQKDILSVDVTGGLPAGSYKLSSINTAANHQPVLVPIAQHGSLDDAIYFTVR